MKLSNVLTYDTLVPPAFLFLKLVFPAVVVFDRVSKVAMALDVLARFTKITLFKSLLCVS